MTILEDRVQQLRSEIVEAFREAPYPGDDRIASNEDGQYDPERTEIVEGLRGKDWRSLSRDHIRQFGEALPWLTPAAFRYFLPAYLVACVDGREGINVAPDSVLFNLSPPRKRKGYGWDQLQSRAAIMTPNEQKAILHYLELAEERERDDWASIGREPPEDRVGAALAFWRELAGESKGA